MRRSSVVANLLPKSVATAASGDAPRDTYADVLRMVISSIRTEALAPPAERFMAPQVCRRCLLFCLVTVVVASTTAV
jgi:hypothetical protein